MVSLPHRPPSYHVDLTPDMFYRPLAPTPRDQGDPFFVEAPPEADTEFQFYIYTTDAEPAGEHVLPVYGTDDLRRVEQLGEVLEGENTQSHWAPMVRYVPGLDRPWVMISSHGQGLGEQAHIGHTLLRADALAPEGPFIYSGHDLTPDADFAIDADVYRSDGKLKLAYAVDFVDSEPLGTGIVEVDVSEDLTTVFGEPRVVTRPGAPWEKYDDNRVMPWKEISGVDWERGDTVEWGCNEAPVGGLTNKHGQEVTLYSGGNFADYYAVGALVRKGERLVDVTNEEGHFVLQPQPDAGLFSIGHPSLVDLGEEKALVTHIRFGSPDAPRQMALVPLLENAQGYPYAPTAREVRRRTQQR